MDCDIRHVLQPQSVYAPTHCKTYYGKIIIRLLLPSPFFSLFLYLLNTKLLAVSAVAPNILMNACNTSIEADRLKQPTKTAPDNRR